MQGSDLAATAKTPTGGLKTQNGKYMFFALYGGIFCFQ